MHSIHIDPHDPETLAFDEIPNQFVLLHVTPVVFTVRGLRHFSPRFRLIGVNISDIKRAHHFRKALMEWTLLEASLLTDAIASKANATHQSNEHQVLYAALIGDIDAAEAAMDRLEHRRRAGLTVVRSDDPVLQ